MPKVLVLAPSGFGKSTSLGQVPELGIIGLDPSQTYLISVTSKPLPFPGSSKSYPIVVLPNLQSGNRVITDNPSDIEIILKQLVNSPHKNIVWDDSNYVMQNWYMANALSKGWDRIVSSF